VALFVRVFDNAFQTYKEHATLKRTLTKTGFCNQPLSEKSLQAKAMLKQLGENKKKQLPCLNKVSPRNLNSQPC
jgi:hypothetical protein